MIMNSNEEVNAAGEVSGVQTPEMTLKQALNATSASGEASKILGVLTIAVSPLALLASGPFFVTAVLTAATAIVGGAALAAVGSSACSNKQAAALTELIARKSLK